MKIGDQFFVWDEKTHKVESVTVANIPIAVKIVFVMRPDGSGFNIDPEHLFETELKCLLYWRDYYCDMVDLVNDEIWHEAHRR